MAAADLEATTPVHPRDIGRWEREHDVVIAGCGAAGGCAAIEAARAGADTLVLERMSRGGGSAALSTGLTYFGGGTRVQKACGFDDSVENMTRYVTLAAGAHPDEERVRTYCERSVEHFDWFCALGVEFNDTFYDDKVTHPLTEDCLLFTGNEDVHPFCEHATPVPRGHKPAREGEAGGYLMEVVLRGVREAGARVLNDCLALRLVQNDAGRVVGVVVRHARREICIRARRGVMLATGGFIMNDEMLTRHAPSLLNVNYKTGTAGDDGRGIRMGMEAGGEAIHMEEGLLLNAWYPPSSHLKGVLVDGSGQRFTNEDAAIGRTSDAIVRKAEGTAWLIVDDEIYGRTQAHHRLAAVEESFADLERALELPAGVLVATLERYNEHAAGGRDPLFHKARRHLRPLSVPPFAALDCGTARSIFGGFTLGGLRTLATGEVLSPSGRAVAGLYAAGRTTAGLCREGRTYASGLSIGDASFFGRLAGQRMAAADPIDDGSDPRPG